jgi:hypothetical protein
MFDVDLTPLATADLSRCPAVDVENDREPRVLLDADGRLRVAYPAVLLDSETGSVGEVFVGDRCVAIAY